MRLEYSSGSSNKFWSIVVDGNTHTVCWGKVGTEGRWQTKTFLDSSAAQTDAEKKIAAKKKKGYLAVAGSASTPTALVSGPAVSVPKPREPKKPKAPKKKSVSAPAKKASFGKVVGLCGPFERIAGHRLQESSGTKKIDSQQTGLFSFENHVD